MDGATRVYELDVEEVITDLVRALNDRGIDVVEQVPAGVWWFRTDEDRASLCRRMADAFHELVCAGLHDIPQEG